MMIGMGVSLACASVAAYYLMTLGLDARRQNDRLLRACGWLIAGYAAHWITWLALIAGGER